MLHIAGEPSVFGAILKILHEEYQAYRVPIDDELFFPIHASFDPEYLSVILKVEAEKRARTLSGRLSKKDKGMVAGIGYLVVVGGKRVFRYRQEPEWAMNLVREASGKACRIMTCLSILSDLHPDLSATIDAEFDIGKNNRSDIAKTFIENGWLVKGKKNSLPGDPLSILLAFSRNRKKREDYYDDLIGRSEDAMKDLLDLAKEFGVILE